MLLTDQLDPLFGVAITKTQINSEQLGCDHHFQNVNQLSPNGPYLNLNL